MIRIKRFKPTCWHGFPVHVCKDYKAQTLLIQGTTLSECIICGHDAGVFHRTKDGQIKYKE